MLQTNTNVNKFQYKASEKQMLCQKSQPLERADKCYSATYRTKLAMWLKDDLCCRQFSRLQHKVVHELKEDPKPWRH